MKNAKKETTQQLKTKKILKKEWNLTNIVQNAKNTLRIKRQNNKIGVEFGADLRLARTDQGTKHYISAVVNRTIVKQTKQFIVQAEGTYGEFPR